MIRVQVQDLLRLKWFYREAAVKIQVKVLATRTFIEMGGRKSAGGFVFSPFSAS